MHVLTTVTFRGVPGLAVGQTRMHNVPTPSWSPSAEDAFVRVTGALAVVNRVEHMCRASSADPSAHVEVLSH